MSEDQDFLQNAASATDGRGYDGAEARDYVRLVTHLSTLDIKSTEDHPSPSEIPLFVQEQAAYFAGRVIGCAMAQPSHSAKAIRDLEVGQSIRTHGELPDGGTYEVLTSLLPSDSIIHRVTVTATDGKTVLLICEFLNRLTVWRLFAFIPGPWVVKSV